METGEWVKAVAAVSMSEAERLSTFRDQVGLEGATAYVGTGNVATALLDRADEICADLLVVGAHSRRALRERLLGATSDRVLRHAHTAVLVMPERALARWSAVEEPAMPVRLVRPASPEARPAQGL
jgi:nucleotide-binding universal stress UspA family protein